jgi:3-keto-5-aminohexanoate cleavage enzyme
MIVCPDSTLPNADAICAAGVPSIAALAALVDNRRDAIPTSESVTMDKLIITNCAADTSMHAGVPQRLDDSDVLGEEVARAAAAGAAIVHIHAPPDDFGAWANHTRAIRDRCGIMIQYGISTQSVEQRRAVMKNRPEMISVALGAHNLVFLNRDMQRLHSRAELANMMRLCRDHGVKPEFEITCLGDVWLLRDLIDKDLVSPPYMVTPFFGRPGGTWSPPTAAEFLSRIEGLPDNTYYMTSVTGASHLLLESMAVMSGGHVRVGTEDEPYLRPGVLGDNAEHVARIARIAGEFGREVASVREARAMLGISG